MSLSDKLSALFVRRRFGMKPGLERICEILGALGNPEQTLLAVHIAGTNGKGSVAAMVASVLQEAGFGDVGRYTSPHLVRFNERIAIGGVPISDDALESALDEVLAVAPPDATFFEVATATGFLAFKKANVRIAVIETGLGGRLDATNVLTPLVSVITHIGLEHCEYLGDTLALIAAEKAGIVKPNRPIVIGAMPEEAENAILATARRLSAPIRRSADVASVIIRENSITGLTADCATVEKSIGRVHLPIGGAYQAENLATALTALAAFEETTGLEISAADIKRGLSRVSWPCRFQLISDEPPTIVDGAHNPDAAHALAQSLKSAREKKPVALVAGFCDDKDVEGVLEQLAPLIKFARAVETPTPRTLSAETTANAMRLAGIRDAEAAENLAKALKAAENWARENDGMILVCGSLFLAGQMLGQTQQPNELLKNESH